MGCKQLSSVSNRVTPGPDVTPVGWTLHSSHDIHDVDDNAPPPYTEEAQDGHVTLLKGGASSTINHTNALGNRQMSTMEILPQTEGLGGVRPYYDIVVQQEPRPQSVISNSAYEDNLSPRGDEGSRLTLQHVQTLNGHTEQQFLPHLMPLVPAMPLLQTRPNVPHPLATHNQHRHRCKHKKKRRRRSSDNHDSNHDNGFNDHEGSSHDHDNHHYYDNHNRHHHRHGNTQHNSHQRRNSRHKRSKIQLPPLKHDELGHYQDGNKDHLSSIVSCSQTPLPLWLREAMSSDDEPSQRSNDNSMDIL